MNSVYLKYKKCTFKKFFKCLDAVTRSQEQCLAYTESSCKNSVTRRFK